MCALVTRHHSLRAEPTITGTHPKCTWKISSSAFTWKSVKTVVTKNVQVIQINIGHHWSFYWDLNANPFLRLGMNLHAVCHTVCWLDVCCAWRCSIHSIKILPVCADQVDAKLDGATDVWRVHLAVENCFCHFPDAFVLELFLCIVGMLSTGDSWHIVARIWANQEALEAYTFFWFSTSWVGILFHIRMQDRTKKSVFFRFR